MGFFKKLGKFASYLVDVRVDKWVNWKYLKESSLGLKGQIDHLFVVKKNTRQETFEEALHRLQLSEHDLTQRKKEFLFLSLFFIVSALGLFIYTLHWAFLHFISATVISFCICAFCLAQAFRFHFWYFQVKERRLGCTVSEWLHAPWWGSPS